MKLALIIPTYDNLSGLKNLIKSIYKHTKGKFKVYVIEDGQNDKTIKWLYGLKKPLSVHCHIQNKGIATSWNNGLQLAMDDDCTHFAILNDDVELCQDWWKDCQQAFKDNLHMVCLDQPSPIPLTGWFFILDRECVENIGIFDEQFSPFCGEDHDYWLRFQRSGMKYAKVSLDVKHGGSTTVKKLDSELYKQVRNDNWQRLRKKYPNMRFQAQHF